MKTLVDSHVSGFGGNLDFAPGPSNSVWLSRPTTPNDDKLQRFQFQMGRDILIRRDSLNTKIATLLVCVDGSAANVFASASSDEDWLRQYTQRDLS